MLYRGLLIFLLTCLPFIGQGQDSREDIVPLPSRKIRPAWIGISYGLDRTSFRDQATSPLFYSGTLQSVALFGTKSDFRRHTSLGVRYSFGTSLAINAGSRINNIYAWYSRLYQIPSRSMERWNFKVGGMLSFAGINRINSSLRNSGLGNELFANLMASGKVEWDISRREAKRKKFLFLKFNLPQRRRNLAFQLNLGLLNTNYRNGFSYLGQSSVANDPVPFDGYELNVFSGFRASSSLDYTIYLRNNNGLRLSYLWDAFSTGGDRDRFVLAHHALQFSFLFNTK